MTYEEAYKMYCYYSDIAENTSSYDEENNWISEEENASYKEAVKLAEYYKRFLDPDFVEERYIYDGE